MTNDELPKYAKEKKESIEKTFARTFILLNSKNQSQSIFSWLPIEVIRLIIQNILHSAHPEFISFLALSLRKFYEYEKAFEKNKAQILKINFDKSLSS